ncbi:MAG: hypothetical protein GY862_38865 [Gammaproteobacteria bacterium]|nr:hypothetical protein [Gammaproteobacteria bacterium]
MLTEVANVKQLRGDKVRRWFSDDFFSLFLWYTQEGTIMHFELRYGKGRGKYALTWTLERGYMHCKSEDSEMEQLSPKIECDDEFDWRKTAQRFLKSSGQIDPEVASFVHGKLIEYPKETVHAFE